MGTPVKKSDPRVRVLVADDSPTVQMMMCRMLDNDPGIEVVGTASNGEEAVKRANQLRPDLITMDVNMPVMDGLTAIENIMAYQPLPILVVSSVLDRNNAARALGAGAVDVVPKPSPQSLMDFTAESAELQEKIKVLSKVRVITHPRARLVRRVRPAPAFRRALGTSVVAIASSTGGPQALQCILSCLPGDLHAGILIVQHIADGFTDGLVDWLNTSTKLTVRKGRDGLLLKPGEAVIAPDGIHMILTAGSRIRLVDRKIPSPHKPSADVLLASVADVCGPAAIGVVLTGMGRDGARGMKAIHEAGGHTIAQDEETSVIFSMAREAIQIGAVEKVAALQDIGTAITEFA